MKSRIGSLVRSSFFPRLRKRRRRSGRNTRRWVARSAFLEGLEERRLLALTVNVVADSVSESAGNGATVATVTRDGPTTDLLLVTITSSDTSEATAQGNVFMQAGVGSVAFLINAVDDVVVDGTQTVTFTASATGHSDGSDTLDVTDDDAATLSVAIAADSIVESAGAAATNATVTRVNASVGSALTVTLASDDSSETTVPASVIIPAGSTSATFNLDAVDDAIIDGTQTVTITATAPGLTAAADTLNVTDDDMSTLTLSIVADSIAETGGAAATPATVTRNSSNVSALTVTLASNDTSEATVPASVTIAAGSSSATFDINAIDDTVLDGTQTVTVTASAAAHSGGTDTLDVTDVELLRISPEIDSRFQRPSGMAV